MQHWYGHWPPLSQNTEKDKQEVFNRPTSTDMLQLWTHHPDGWDDLLVSGSEVLTWHRSVTIFISPERQRDTSPWSRILQAPWGQDSYCTFIMSGASHNSGQEHNWQHLNKNPSCSVSLLNILILLKYIHITPILLFRAPYILHDTKCRIICLKISL